jgi:predicted GNAT family acetyltransferase
MTELTITDNPGLRRFEGHLAGDLVGYCEYEEREGEMIFPHTETLPHYRGHGYAAQIVAVAIANAEQRGLTIVPECWFVADFLRARESART